MVLTNRDDAAAGPSPRQHPDLPRRVLKPMPVLG
jgi:hypothetical protein